MSNRESATGAAARVMQVMDPKGYVDTCVEWVRVPFGGLLFSLARAGFGKAVVTDGRRTFDEQCELYGQGRSKDELAVIGIGGGYAQPKRRRVTWIDPRYSRHVKGLAIDVDFGDYAAEHFEIVEDICRQLHITWGGVWSVRDYGHFEM